MPSPFGTLAAAVLLTLGAARIADAAGDDRRLEAVVETCDAAGAEATAQALIQSGADAIDWIVRVRLELTKPATEWSPCAHAAAAITLRSRSNAARRALAGYTTGEAAETMNAHALGVLADLGEADDLGTLVEWAVRLDAQRKVKPTSAPDEDDEPELDLRSPGALALRDAVARLANLAADDSRVWKQNIASAPPALAISIVRGLADSDHPQAIARLAELFDYSELSESLLLAELARAARRSDREHDESARAAVRPLLQSSDVDELRDAALCIGALGDDRSAPTLARLLDHANAGVRANAAWALSRLTARRIGPASPDWTEWLEAESKWWRDSARRELANLTNSDRRLRAEAARELSLHRYPRHELAIEIARALPLDDLPTATIACASLVQLKSASAVDVLERRLASEPEGAACKLVAETLATLATRARTHAESSKL